MSKREPALVLEHLEDVSWRVIAEYPHVLQTMIRRRHGVYALYRRDKLYYVGLASNLMGRLKSHLRDRHHGSWDQFSVWITVKDEHVRELEALVLRIVEPEGNRVKGRLRKAKNLQPRLNEGIRAIDDNRRALLLGGHVARRRLRAMTRKGKGTRVLAGLVPRRMALRHGKALRASLRRDGAISFRGKLYDSPTAACKVATGGTRNGWTFWKYRERRGKWVPLKNLRR